MHHRSFVAFCSLALALSPLVTTGCGGGGDSTSSADQALGNSDDKGAPTTGPTENFSKVSDSVYRGARPDLEAIRALKERYGIKTILSLETADYIEASPKVVAEEKANAESLGVEFVHLPITSFDPALRAGFDRRIDEIEATLADARRAPVYVHCRRGKDRTGLVVGIYRVTQQGWTPERAHDEMLEKGFFRFFQNLDLYFKLKTGMRDE